MLKKGILLLFLLFVPIVFSQTGSVTIIEDTITTNQYSTCESGDGCNLHCLNGDLDCTCSTQRGYVCNENEICQGTMLKNWNGVTCCSLECENKLLAKFKSVSGIVRAGTLERDTNMSIQILLFIEAMIIGIGLFILLGLYKVKESVSYFAEKELKDGIGFIGKEEELIISKIKHKKNINTNLLNNIIRNLTPDERKIILKLVDNNGIKKDKFSSLLGFSKDKLNYCLVRLSRRGIIKLSGNEDNPTLNINNWLR